jgi:hypothetical protein
VQIGAVRNGNVRGIRFGRLIGEPVLNSVIVLLVVTSVLGPILTEWFAKQLPPVAAGEVADEPAPLVVLADEAHHPLV